jgi:hypothetical protein
MIASRVFESADFARGEPKAALVARRKSKAMDRDDTNRSRDSVGGFMKRFPRMIPDDFMHRKMAESGAFC